MTEPYPEAPPDPMADDRPMSPDGEIHSGQIRMAYRLAHSQVDRLLHVHNMGWHYWDGTRWAEDDKGKSKRAVLEVLRSSLVESFDRGDTKLRDDVTKCNRASGVAGILDIGAALVEFAARICDMDANPNLLNTANGTYDLATDQLRAHDPDDRLTCVTRAHFDPDADPTVWNAFLATVLPDADERAYLQRLVGQSLYGRVTEHLFPVLTGVGQNGKTTMYSALCHALGDYAKVIDPSLLMARERGGNAGPELMTLLGARIVVGSETGEGRKLDEAAMKRLTGGDPITARKLYREPVQWDPTHQLLFVSNHKPKVHGDDPAVWNRIRVIEFGVVIPEADRDPRLPETLKEQAAAILQWAVQGWRDYSQTGMAEPDSVKAATDAYKTASDDVSRFLAECTYESPNGVEASSDLWERWLTWHKDDGGDDLSQKAFGQALDQRGFTAKKGARGARLRRGLVLYSDRDEPSETGPTDAHRDPVQEYLMPSQTPRPEVD